MDSVVRRIIVEDVMLENPPSIEAFDKLGKIIQTIVDNGLPAIPVVNSEMRLLGVLERRSLMERFLSK
ncbi:MAG TPA: CBS domain-containing protein [Candidatus Korarchaeota archaeon]|nr:CBS domain-containing protein [Candidatus Korarchaeota archaeon]